MQPSEIKELIDFLAKSNLDEVNIETENFKISVKRHAQQVVTVAAPAPQTSLVVPRVEAANPATAPQPVSPAVEPPQPSAAHTGESGKKIHYIKSPIIGTFYRASSPENPPFVNVGDEIKPGKPVCIIEAMKLFNEIESDVAGRIIRVLVENASPVEYDQPLFEVELA